jgi:hypothetical protein
MKNIYYRTAYTEGECLIACNHEHQTVIAATACIAATGGYVVGVEDGAIRTLTDAEETEFQNAMCGSKVEFQQNAAFHLLMRLEPQGF